MFEEYKVQVHCGDAEDCNDLGYDDGNNADWFR